MEVCTVPYTIPYTDAKGAGSAGLIPEEHFFIVINTLLLAILPYSAFYSAHCTQYCKSYLVHSCTLYTVQSSVHYTLNHNIHILLPIKPQANRIPKGTVEG